MSELVDIPAELLPRDGRFGSGPSRVRPAQLEALMAAGTTYLGTSHRQATVKDQVGRLRRGLTELLGLPAGWELVVGNGGTTVFWDAALFGLIESSSQHAVHGEFSGKFASCVERAPFLAEPDVRRADPGSAASPVAVVGIDAYCLVHNETSTGVAVAPRRPDGVDADSLVLVDATSAAGALTWDPDQVDVYYFAPQKALASDGGLWLAACSPAAVERIERIEAAGRWIPESIRLSTALDNSRKNQTYNTPALATVLLAAEQVDWLNERGGLAAVEQACRHNSGLVYDWAERSPFAAPFVVDPELRSPVVCTIDFDGVDAATVAGVLRSHGVVDVEPYRKLGRNQLRIATFPAVPSSDVEALLTCVDLIIERLV